MQPTENIKLNQKVKQTSLSVSGPVLFTSCKMVYNWKKYSTHL